jgi:hypothetical protein
MLRQVDADRQAEEVVELAHPLRIAVGQVVVDRDDVHALAGQGIEVHRQRGGERLALAGAHLGDLAVVQRHAAEHLHVEVAHLHDALAASRTTAKASGSMASSVSPCRRCVS